MRGIGGLSLDPAAIALALGVGAAPALKAQQAGGEVVIDADDIGGIVRGPSGPEAGVWVIAETDDLPTKFARIVVTDDAGRYVVPDLPRARYQVWVRGYGLADAPNVNGEPGQLLHLTAVPARDETEAARVYPAIYWYSTLKVPDASALVARATSPKRSPSANGWQW